MILPFQTLCHLSTLSPLAALNNKQIKDLIRPISRELGYGFLWPRFILFVQRCLNKITREGVLSAVYGLLIMSMVALSPSTTSAVPYDYHGYPADVIEGVPMYTVGTIFGTGAYPGPPATACQAAMELPSQLGYVYTGVTDLGGIDVFDPNQPYYHNYSCNILDPFGLPNIFSMSRAYPRCPSSPYFYHVVVQNYWELIPPLSVNACIRFLPPSITIDLTKKDSDFCQGNPIMPGTGNKLQVETDYVGSGAFPIVYTRTYNSLATLGSGWRDSYARSIKVVKSPLITTPTAIRGDGKAWTFRMVAGYWASDGDVNARLSSAYDYIRGGWGWTLITPDHDEIETYDPSGKLITIQDRSGLTQSLTYSDASSPLSIAPVAGLLIRVTDTFGRQLNFAYDGASRIKTMTDPVGGLYQYGYDAAGNLASVTYPDTRVRIYVYNESAFTANTSLPNALTGIVDENTQRYANFGYSANGLAILSEHAGGAERVGVSYGTPPIVRTSVFLNPSGN